MRFVARCYRAHDPRWSFAPTSGAGAAITGGRFNRRGEATLYLSLDIGTVFLECTQGMANRMQPLTVCEYDVDCDPVADLRTEPAHATLGVAWTDLACGWMVFLRSGRDAPSWKVADRLRAEGHAGMLVPSFAPGARSDQINLVLWRWGPDLPASVTVYDPERRLPTDQRSWSQ